MDPNPPRSSSRTPPPANTIHPLSGSHPSPRHLVSVFRRSNRPVGDNGRSPRRAPENLATAGGRQRGGQRATQRAGRLATVFSSHNRDIRQETGTSVPSPRGISTALGASPSHVSNRTRRQTHTIAPGVLRVPGAPRTAQSQHRWSRRPREYCANPDFEVEGSVSFFSVRTGFPQAHVFRAVFSRRFEYSLVHQSVLNTLGMHAFDLAPGTSDFPPGRHLFCPIGIIRPRQYVGLVIEVHQLEPPQGSLFAHFLVLNEAVPERGPQIYLGRRFWQEYFDGQLSGPP
jgi:hypothetical protein